MPVGATLGAATLGAGASIASSNAQNSAARQQTAAAQGTADQQTQLYRDIFNQQRADFEPFRQSEIRRAGLADRILGIGAPTAGAGTVPQGPQTTLPGLPTQGPRFGPGSIDAREPQAGGFQPRFGVNSMMALEGGGQGLPAPAGAQSAQAGQAVFNPKGGTDPSLTPQLAGAQNAGIAVGEPNPATAGQSTPVFDPSIAGAQEFNDSLFAAALQANNRRDMSAIDQNLAAQGLAFSGAQQEATADAVTRNTQGGLNNFLNFLLGAPSAGAATQGSVQAGQNFAAQTGNALGNLGAAQQQSAFQQGQNQANMFGNLATAGGSALGAFSLGGKK